MSKLKLGEVFNTPKIANVSHSACWKFTHVPKSSCILGPFRLVIGGVYNVGKSALYCRLMINNPLLCIKEKANSMLVKHACR